MIDGNRLYRQFSAHLWPEDIKDWISSLPPIGLAFVFYIAYIILSGIEPRELYIAYGVAVGFIILEIYWVIRGWLNNHVSTIIMGIIGIILAVFSVGLYTSAI